MLQVMNGTISETLTTTGGYVPTSTTGQNTFNCIDYYTYPYQTVYWNSYPVYICTDKTKKAIEVLKALQSEKLLDCKSVPRFIELVEKISNLL